MNTIKEYTLKLNKKEKIPIIIDKDRLYPLIKVSKYDSVEAIPMEEIKGIVKIKDRTENKILIEVCLCDNEIDEKEIYNTHDIKSALLGVLNDNKTFSILKLIYFVLVEKDTIISIQVLDGITKYKL